MTVILIIGILATLGVFTYVSMIDRARVVSAMSDVKVLSFAINDHWMRQGDYPANLAVIGEDERDDPWGRPYEYSPAGGGGARKDASLVPINTDYDLFSKGEDGLSAPALTAPDSRDDIVRAADGGFIGLAENY